MNLLPQPRFVDLGDRLHDEHRRSRSTSTRRCRAQGYTLTIGDDGVELVGADDAGCFYGRATLAQLARLHDGALPIGTIRDHPDLAIRGVMLDVSRDKVPTMDTLYALIDRLASWKVNQVQLYSEHTFAYRNHPEVHAEREPVHARRDPRPRRVLPRAPRRARAEPELSRAHEPLAEASDRYRELALAPDGFVDP